MSAGNHKVSLILDDLASIEPWTPRGIKVHGTAGVESRVGQFGPGDYLVIRPAISWSWGIEGESFRGGRFQPHKTIWAALPEVAVKPDRLGEDYSAEDSSSA